MVMTFCASRIRYRKRCKRIVKSLAVAHVSREDGARASVRPHSRAYFTRALFSTSSLIDLRRRFLSSRCGTPAVEAARKLGSHGERAQFCIMGGDGKFHPRWSYGRDGLAP